MSTLNPPSKTVKGLAEGTLRTTMTHLVKGDVILVMTATANPSDFIKAAPTVAPKRAFWATVDVVAMSGLVVVAEDGDRIIITDCAPQTAVTIRDRDVVVAEAATLIEDSPLIVDDAMIPGCPTCVLPMDAGHVCPDFMLNARGDYMAEGMPTPGDTVELCSGHGGRESGGWQRLPRRERKTYATVSGPNKHKSTRLNRRRKQVAA